MPTPIALIATLCVALPATSLAQVGRHALTTAPYELTLTDGTRVAATLGRLPVPERRAVPASRSIDLAFIRLPSTNQRPGSPIVFLNGDPAGTPATRVAQLPELFPFFDELRKAADVIILDYRGTGMSQPDLRCPAAAEHDVNMFVSQDRALRALQQLGRACAAHLTSNGVDLRGYTWNEVADDVADLRAALGVEKVSLLGFSSGTHASLAVIKRYEAMVDRVALIGTEGPDHTRKLPSNIDAQLRLIAALVERDTVLRRSIPDFLGLISAVLDRFERQPVTVEVKLPRAGGKVSMPVGRFALEYITAKSLSGPSEFEFLPVLYQTISQGDHSVLTRVIQRFVGGPPRSALAYLMDGASGASTKRRHRIAREATRSMVGNAANFPFPEIGAVWNYADLGEKYRAPIRSRVPALFLTGALDGNTPPHQAEEVRRGFPNSLHLIVANGAHNSPFVMPEAARATAAFFRGEDVSKVLLSLPAPRFVPLRPRTDARVGS